MNQLLIVQMLVWQVPEQATRANWSHGCLSPIIHESAVDRADAGVAGT